MSSADNPRMKTCNSSKLSYIHSLGLLEQKVVVYTGDIILVEVHMHTDTHTQAAIINLAYIMPKLGSLPQTVHIHAFNTFQVSF